MKRRTDLTHDNNGNVTAFGTDTFAYSSENLLTSASVGGVSTTLSYDPAMRLYQTVSGGTTSRFAYDGLDALAEYNASNALQRRWVYDPTTGQPLVWYEGSGTGSTVRRYLSADERGSVISVSDGTGASLAVNTYDEYGIPGSANLGRYGYTGQAWLPGMGLWYYKARVYHPVLGRFPQADPIGYEGGLNLYAYVFNDPINLTDPLGLCVGGRLCEKEIDQATAALKSALKAMGYASSGLSLDQLLTLASDVIDFWSGIEMQIIEAALNEQAEQNTQLAELSWGERQIARLAFSSDKTLQENITAILNQAAGRELTRSEVNRILTDVMRGPSTTLSNLRELGSIRVGSTITLTNRQTSIVNTYVRELPNTPLNNELRHGWNEWLSRRMGR